MNGTVLHEEIKKFVTNSYNAVDNGLMYVVIDPII